MNNAIKIVLAILFFLCLADMPYGFYQFVRFAGLIGFAVLAYQANQQGRQTEMMAITAPTQKAGFRVPKTVLWLIKH